jgi:hypothetical protein
MTQRRNRLKDVQVLLTGAASKITCDVVRQLTREDAQVTVADQSEPVLARLQRDLGLFRTPVKTAHVDLMNYTEMRLFADNLRALGALPHLIICCCDGMDCPARLAASLLQPSLFVHALPIARWRLLGMVDALSIPSLPHLLDQRRARGMLPLQDRSRRVSIAGHPFSVDRCLHPPEPDPEPRASSRSGRRLRVVGEPTPKRMHRFAAAALPAHTPWPQTTETA